MLALKRIRALQQNKGDQLVTELVGFAKLQHPCIVSFCGAFYDQASHETVLATEYMGAGSLDTFVKSYGAMNEKQVKHISKQLLLGIAYLHEHFHIHRDLKPGNILLSQQGQVKLADFGLLKELQTTFSQTDTLLGTIVYMSPERLDSKHYGFPSDIWSFGLIVMFLAQGKLPYVQTLLKTF